MNDVEKLSGLVDQMVGESVATEEPFAYREARALTEAQAERLAWLIKECGEVQHAAARILLHGYQGRVGNLRRTRRMQLERELGHMRAAIEAMFAAADVRLVEVRTSQQRREHERSMLAQGCAQTGSRQVEESGK